MRQITFALTGTLVIFWGSLSLLYASEKYQPGSQQIAKIIKGLESDNGKERDITIKKLIFIGKPAVKELMRYIESDKGFTKKFTNLVETLEKEIAENPGAREQLKFFMHKLRTSSEKVPPQVFGKHNAIKLLGKLGKLDAPASIPFLIALLGDFDMDVNYYAYYALRRITHQDIMFSIYDSAKERKKSIENWRKWWQANSKRIANNRGLLKQEKELLFVLKNGSSYRVNSPSRPLKVVTNAGKLTILWKDLKSVHAQGERYKIITKHYSINGFVELSSQELIAKDSKKQIEGAQITSIQWANIDNNQGNYLGGNILVVENSGNRVIEMDRRGKIIWQFKKYSHPYSAQRLENGNTLITYYRYGPVIEVNRAGKIVWHKKFNNPVDAKRLANGNTLVSEYGGKRVVEVEANGEIVWQKVIGTLAYEADRLANGNTLISTNNGKKVIEVDQAGKVVWQINLTGRPVSADRLANGNTLIALYDQNRVIEVNKSGKIVWQKVVKSPYDVHRLPNGNTILASFNSNLLVEMDQSGKIVWQKKCIGPLRAYK